MTRSSKLILLFCCFSLVGIAQEQGVDSATLEVDLTTKLAIKNANKLNVPIRKYPISVKDIKFEYDIAPRLYKVNTYFREPMQPIALGDVQLPSLSPFYGQFGLGTRRNTLLDLYYSSNRKQSWTYSARGYHRSGTGATDASGFGNSLVQLQGKKNFNKHVLTGDFNFEQRRSHLYGYNYDSTIFETPDSIRRDFFTYGGKLGFSNARSNQTSHHYNTNLSGYYFNDNLSKHEWDIRFDANIREHLKNGDHLQFKADYDYTSYGDSLRKLNRNIVRVDAAYLHEKGNLKVKGGLKAVTENTDTVIQGKNVIADYSNIELFPDIHAEYKLVKNYLISYTGITGDLMKNDYRSMVSVNPFVNDSINLSNTVNSLRAYLGIKGSLSSNWLFNFNVNYSNFKQFLLFANNDLNGNTFLPVYSGKNSSMVKVHGEIQFKEHERWMVNFSGDYNYYNFYTYAPLNLPTLEGHLSARYNFQNKIVAKFEIDAFNARFASNETQSDTIDLKGAVDISFGGDYYLNDNFAVYASISNLLNQRYQLWNRYPVQGLQAWIGIRFAF